MPADHHGECEDCGELHGPQAFAMFLEHIHDVVAGGRLVADDTVRLKLPGGDVEVTLVGVSYDRGLHDGDEEPDVVSFFALALNEQLVDLLEIPDRVCQTCVDEQAAQILDGTDLDGELAALRNRHPHQDKGEQSE